MRRESRARLNVVAGINLADLHAVAADVASRGAFDALVPRSDGGGSSSVPCVPKRETSWRSASRLPRRRRAAREAERKKNGEGSEAEGRKNACRMIIEGDEAREQV